MTDRNTVFITKGIPGSGKSTWAKRYILDHYGDVKRINRDDLRAMIDGGKYDSDNERYIIAARDALINAALNAHKDVIIDDTNLNPKVERGIRKLVEHRANVEVIFFNTDLDTCIERDSKREGSAHVGEDVIRKMHQDWQGWQHIDATVSKSQFELIEQDPSLPHAYILDIDGTMAHNNGHRGWYDWSKVYDDDPVEVVVNLTHQLLHHPVAVPTLIIFSGRDGICREDTEKWLEFYGVEYSELHMRPEGTSHDDAIVKSDLFDQHIKDKYYVEAVFDDRPKVCRMWRQRGLFVFQVGDPYQEF